MNPAQSKRIQESDRIPSRVEHFIATLGFSFVLFFFSSGALLKEARNGLVERGRLTLLTAGIKTRRASITIDTNVVNPAQSQEIEESQGITRGVDHFMATLGLFMSRFFMANKELTARISWYATTLFSHWALYALAL